jgi:hypothetical protein
LITTLDALYGPFFRKPATVAALEPPAPRPTVVNAAPSPDAIVAKETGGDARTQSPEESASPQQAQASVPAAAAVIGSRRIDGAPASRREYVVEVLVEVKNGVVTDARVWNPRPGAAAYETVAVKMARERRYPVGFTGGERVRIRVKP